MKKSIMYLLLLGVIICSCDKSEESLAPSEESIFPDIEQSSIDIELQKMFAPYNTRVEYRYIKNLLPNDWYNIAPIEEELVLPTSRFLLDYWVKPLESSSNKALVKKTFPKKIVYTGSPAFNLDGSRISGQAEGGTLIRFTECNSFDVKNKNWVKFQLSTAFHEYCHILHQTFKLPDEYRKVTPNNYTRNGWKTINLDRAITLGMVTPYATKSVEEDFVELYALYVTGSQRDVNIRFVDQAIPANNPDSARQIIEYNKGRSHIRKKFAILKSFLSGRGIDIEKTRVEVQNKINGQ